MCARAARDEGRVMLATGSAVQKSLVNVRRMSKEKDT